MRPRMSPSLSPPFYELDEYTFQRLCCDVFERQQGIATCSVYGRRGQGQRGIDLLARRSGGDGVEIGQCKCYQNFLPSGIRKASDEFCKHLAYWQSRNVRRFILFVACDLDSTQQQDEIGTQTERFAKYSIAYEAWAANTLRVELAPHADIVQRHIPSHDWVENICGHVGHATSAPIGTPSGLPLAMGLLSTQVERLSSELSRVIAAQLEACRESYREGRRREAYMCVQTLRHNESWHILETPLQARILRVLATYALTLDGDTSSARDFAHAASCLDPSGDDAIFRILLTYQTEGAESALRDIGTPTTLDTMNFEIALLLLGLGRTDEALAKLASLLHRIEPNAETRRLHALALLTKGELVGAHTHIQLALNERPKWEDVRIAGAMINYFSALAPTVLPPHIVPWPTPVDWPFIRRDTQSLERLRQAKEEFEALATLTDDHETRGLFEIWCLSCLANDPDRQAEAQAFCCHLLENDPTNHRAVVWALARDYAVDLHASERALKDMIEDHNDERA